MSENTFSHIVDHKPGMVDISHKETTPRVARAYARVKIPSVLLLKLAAHQHVNNKGPVFDTAIVAGTMAVKNTAHLIPLCHPLPITGIRFDISIKNEAIDIHCEVTTLWNTGVEMEALTGVSVAALTIFDMCKSVSSEIVIDSIHVVKKTGGKHDYEART